MNWYVKYLGTPWAAEPDPPRSFTCGELVRHVLYAELGIDMPEILANAAVLRECVRDIGNPARYGLFPLGEHEKPRQFDVAYMIRGTRENHVGLGVRTRDGLLIMHCQQGTGTVLESPGEMLGMGVRRINWYRHQLLEDTCPA